MTDQAGATESLSTNGEKRAKWDLFLISLLILFFELACIRWFPSHVLYLTFFTNIVLLAAFLGMSVGCLGAKLPWRMIRWTPLLTLGVVLLAFGFEDALGRFIQVGEQSQPELVYFGTELHAKDLRQFAVPVEVVGGGFFLLITILFVGPGQELGRALNQVPNRVQAYTINIFGSIIGIVLFAVFSLLHLSPIFWFLPVVVLLGYFLKDELKLTPGSIALKLAPLMALPLVADVHLLLEQVPSVAKTNRVQYWSPYYRIDYRPPPQRLIHTNLISHQVMSSREDREQIALAYSLPHLLNKDAGGKPYKNVLIIGAGSGNDVSRALQWGAEHIDAIEIDPVINKLGRNDHPDQPYSDPRVTVHLDDGRNFLRSTKKKYDLVIYALLDSLVLHSSYSNIRLESYLFTQQAFEDIKRCLKPDGTFVSYNYFRQGWVVARVQQTMKKVFEKDPLVLGLPWIEKITEGTLPKGGFTFIMVGNVDHIRDAFSKAEGKDYWLKRTDLLSDKTPNGFEQDPTGADQKNWEKFVLAEVEPPKDELPPATDDWPFLYLRKYLIPQHIIRGTLIMGGIALVLIIAFLALLPKEGGSEPGAGSGWAFPARMFFLGAGFMLIETKAVVHMALLFGSTWIVNTVVFFAILVMILVANLFVLRAKPEKLWPYYVGLFLTLGLNVAIPLDAFLGINRIVQIAASCLLIFTPILFAGVVFAVSFRRSTKPNFAFGANIAGAIMGGLAENTSMLLGFQYLIGVAIILYLLSILDRQKQPETQSATA